jgi:hypothetical protein
MAVRMAALVRFKRAADILAVLQQDWGGAKRFTITRPDELSILDKIVASSFRLLTPNYAGSLPLTGEERRRIKQALPVLCYLIQLALPR